MPIEYNGKIYKPYSNRCKNERFYYRTNGFVDGEKYLHRQLWIDNHGSIPKGYVVHHIDHNSLNNDLSNLKLITLSEHSKHHGTDPKNIAKARETIKIARIYAAKWHKSPEGLRWHQMQADKRFGSSRQK